MRQRLAIASALVLLVSASALRAQESDAAADLVSSWTLVSMEKDWASDAPTRIRGPRGLLILDRAGNVFEFFSTAGDDQSGGLQGDAVQTLANSGGFWGRYAVDEAAGRIAFDSAAGVSPNVRGLSFTRGFELDGDRLVISSTDEPQAQGNTRWVWQRAPVVEHLTPAYREVMGFWQHVEERRVDQSTGEIQSRNERAPSVIVYTPSGFVGVHFPSLGREQFEGDSPSADEARAGMRGYLGYFGTLGVFPGEVSHNILAGVSMRTGSILRRYADIDGDQLIVTLQGAGATTGGNRPRVATEVVLHRLSDVDDMLPADR